MNDTFARLASDNHLKDRVGLSPEGLSERYLYSSDMVFRYEFGRLVGNTDLATTAIWAVRAYVMAVTASSARSLATIVDRSDMNPPGRILAPA